MQPTLARRDPARLAALRQLNLLDAPPDEAFDRLTRLATRLLDVPVAFVSLVDEERDFYLSHCGFPEPLASVRQNAGETICHYAIVSQGPLIIEDTRDHPVGRGNPAEESLAGAAYLGIPIRLSGGEVLGSLCAVDVQPRRWSERDVEVLTELAASLRTEIELRAETQERQKARVRLAAGEEILERVARGEALPVVLQQLTAMVEGQAEGALCSILLLDGERDTLHVAAAPTLPPAFSLGIDGIPVREGAGSCGTAAHRNEPVVVREIARDPLWKDYAALAGAHVLAACWSYPIRAIDGSVLGALALYSRRACEPSAQEVEMVERAAHLASIAVERARQDLELRTTNARLRASEERFRVIFEGSMDALFLYGIGPDDRPTCFQEVNRIACERLGYSREELLRRSFLDLAPPDRPFGDERVVELVERLRADGHWMTESVHVARDGRRIPVEVNARLIELRGQPTVVAIARDISERTQMEAQLRQAQKMEAVGRLAGGVAHDFNNMLTAITGFASLLELELDPASQQREYLAHIQRAADHSAGLTRQLLAFSRKQVLRPECIDLNEMISRTQSMLRRLIGEDIDLLADLDTRVGRVLADPGQVEQVVLNLALNARDAMAGGGRLVLRTRRRILRLAEPRREGFVVPPGRYAVLSISDTGAGMDAQTMAKMFEPFFTTKEVGRGTGLGLSTVYGIVKQSGGYIWADSGVGEGTTFHVLLPEVEAHGAEDRGASAGAALSRGSGTVLLVEDEPAVRLLVQRVLEGSGYAVLSASSGDDALRKLAGWESPVDLLLTDVVMPGGSGQELAGRVRALHPGVRVLFMSGYAAEAVERHGVLAEESQFLQKPFPPARLSRKVAEVLGARAPA